MDQEEARLFGQLKNRTCVVFGAANGGIGFEIAREARSKFGMKVAVCDIDKQRCASAAEKIKITKDDACVKPFTVDISNLAQVESVFESLDDSWIRDLVFVCNAAAVFADSDDTDTLAASALDWSLAYSVNVLGAVHVQKCAVRWFAKTNRCFLVQVGSLSALTGGSGEPYVSSKTALLALTESTHRTIRSKPGVYGHISVHCVLPGAVQTKFAASSIRAKKNIHPKEAYAYDAGSANKINQPDATQALELREMMKMALRPEIVASSVFNQMARGMFYLIVDNDPPLDLGRVLADKASGIVEIGLPSTLEIPPILSEARRRLKALL